MSQFGITFNNRALTYAQAKEQHVAVGDAVTAFLRGNPAREARCEELWLALVNLLDEDDKGAIADCVDLTMPRHFTPLMRQSDSIMAGYAFGIILGEIIDAKDFNDDLGLKPSFEQAWRLFNKRRLEANKVEEGFGCDQSQSWHTLRDIDNVCDGDWKKRILEIAKLAGKMFDAFNYMTKKVKSDDPQEVESVKIGKDIEQLLPQELALLSGESTKDMQAMKVLKGEAQQRKMKGVRTKGRGPLVILIDESGSMHDYGGWQARQRGRNTWAKACAVALVRVAWKEGREVVVVHFGRGCVTQAIPKDNMAALFEMARSFMSGGTEFGSAMRTGITQVADLEARGFKGADIVLITDGEEHDHATHNKMIDLMDTDGVDLWTVAIGQPFRDEAPTRKRAKKYVEADDSMLGQDETAVALVDGLQDAAMDNGEERS